jgi:hypothetical protein
MDLVLFYSENSLVQHNPSLTTTLEHPINAWGRDGLCDAPFLVTPYPLPREIGIKKSCG